MLLKGHLFAPAWPTIARFVDRIVRIGDRLYLYRAGRCVVLRVPGSARSDLSQIYLPLAASLRSLGDVVRYDASARVVDIRTPSAVLVAAGAVAAPPLPRVIFPARVPPTPRPIWNGIPLPRRTPLPVAAPSAPPR